MKYVFEERSVNCGKECNISYWFGSFKILHSFHARFSSYFIIYFEFLSHYITNFTLGNIHMYIISCTYFSNSAQYFAHRNSQGLEFALFLANKNVVHAFLEFMGYKACTQCIPLFLGAKRPLYKLLCPSVCTSVCCNS